MKKYFLLPIILLMFLSSCETEKQSPDKPQIIKKEKISGFVQKGPFVSGTTVTMNELSSELIQTGKVFTSTIINDMGLFEVNNIELISSFVEFTSSGFYFNEVSGEISNSPITLTSLSDISDKNSINVNVLTHLEKRRVETLMKEGKSFSESKTQSRNELLAVFSMSLNNNSSFEEFDISKNTEEGGILLGISIILQGNRSVGQLTELLSRIQNDFGNNGKLNDENILNSLRTSTLSLDFTQIRENIEKRFKELNNNSPVPDFGKQLIKFLSFRNYPLTITIEGEGEVDERIITNPSGREYPYSTVVELTPIPKEGWVFESWGGDLSGNEVPNKITVDGDKSVRVRFKELPKFFLHENGVTCICINVKSGDKGVINGIEYEAVDNNLLKERVQQRADMSKLCTSSVTNLNSLFRDWELFNHPIGNWDVSNVTNMYAVFWDSAFNQDISNWNVSKVTTMSFMFQGSKFNKPIGSWDVSRVVDMGGIFNSARDFNQPIGNWNVSNVKNMWRVFAFSSFNHPLENWDVGNVQNMTGMFWRTPFNHPIGKWNVSNVRDMLVMFEGSEFNQPINNWDLSKVNSMQNMFRDSKFNQSIGEWNVKNVEDMRGMFGDSPFNQNISKWCVTKIQSEPEEFSSNSPLTSENKPKWGTCPD